MSLSDRLQRARTQQLVEAGVLPRDHELEPEPPVVEIAPEPEIEEEPQGLFAPITIEAQPVGLHLVAKAHVDLTDAPDGHDVSSTASFADAVNAANRAHASVYPIAISGPGEGG